jgi:hypothetical protein
MESFEGGPQDGTEAMEGSPSQWLEAVLPFSQALGVFVALAFVVGRTRSAWRLLRRI